MASANGARSLSLCRRTERRNAEADKSSSFQDCFHGRQKLPTDVDLQNQPFRSAASSGGSLTEILRQAKGSSAVRLRRRPNFTRSRPFFSKHTQRQRNRGNTSEHSQCQSRCDPLILT